MHTMQELTKEQWTSEVYALLCKSQGEPVNDAERKNLREWAEAMADCDMYYQEDMTPDEAHSEELSYAS